MSAILYATFRKFVRPGEQVQTEPVVGDSQDRSGRFRKFVLIGMRFTISGRSVRDGLTLAHNDHCVVRRQLRAACDFARVSGEILEQFERSARLAVSHGGASCSLRH
jgi:hypothetical protein